MNKKGHKESLIARHPGNTNAVKFGVHSPRLIGERAQAIAEELLQSFEFTPVEKVAISEAARCIALLEAIDNDLDERGIVDRRGKERNLAQFRVRVSARLERWLDKFSTSIDRQLRTREAPEPKRVDLVRELQRIALGDDPEARTQDRLAALKQLLALKEEYPTEMPRYIEVVLKAANSVETESIGEGPVEKPAADAAGSDEPPTT